MSDFLFRGSLEDLDPKVAELSSLEAERQYRKLILIPSESTSPLAVRESLSSPLHNIYAEGYPSEDTRWMTEEEILDYKLRLAENHRFSDPRYYKGVEYANVIEALARKRCAEAYATDKYEANDIYVNVQALSGGPANNAVYHALVNNGDTVMGMDLIYGGHLSHGSPVNRSGKNYNIVHYSIDPETEKINYDVMEALALEHKPKMIIGGFSSYPWQADWKRMREIADKVGAKLLADISHVSGLVIAGIYPNPIDYAHVVTSTTHKTLNGPRGAIILTTDRLIARKIDRAVFPGEQGGPHVNVFAALATAFKIAKTEEYTQLQKQVVKNCVAMNNQLEARGFKIPFGGTETHLTNIDCKSVVGKDGTPLSGDMAARILDLAGIVTNRNTIPGDKSALDPSGVRLGTPWVTQRGFKEAECIELANIIADLLQATEPYAMPSVARRNKRAKVDFKVYENAKMRVRALATKAGIDFEPTQTGYPHFAYLDDAPQSNDELVAFQIGGEHVRQFINTVVSSNTDNLKPNQKQNAYLVANGEKIQIEVALLDQDIFQISCPKSYFGLVGAWLRDLSDGFLKLDEDILKKSYGPVWVAEAQLVSVKEEIPADEQQKPYYIGIEKLNTKEEPLPEFIWEEKETPLRQTALYETHKALGATMVPFAGWEMPVVYTSVYEEHMATRQAAGLFDVSHMGVYQAEGPHACAFLNSVCANNIALLAIGESCYTHFLDHNANVLDDLLVYRRGTEKYLVVVNASNDEKNWAWLNAVKAGTVRVDNQRPSAKAYGRNLILRNLRDPKAGKEMRVDIALQGPKSRDTLLALGCDWETEKKIRRLQRTQLCEAVVGGFDLVVSRTGYTGEQMAFELFVHPDQSVALWNKILEVGATYGVKPVGLGARDSLRTEAGLPLYGHEMGGENNFGVADAGFRNYVKTYKPWFIGRDAFLAKEEKRKSVVARFRFEEKGVRMAKPGDPVVDSKGKVIGQVTSCAVDRFGTLTGQALVTLKHSTPGTTVYIFQSASNKSSKAPADLLAGDKIAIPTMAKILTRFSKLK